MSERKEFCNFSIEAPIYDVDLPSKIKEKLDSLDLHPNPEYDYSFSVYFDAAVYEESEFYNFPVEWKEYEIKKLEKIENNPNERRRTFLYGVLGQQIHNIRDALESYLVKFSTANIVGDDMGEINNINQVFFLIFEDSTQPPKRKNALTCSVVNPKRMGTFQNFEEACENMVKALEEQKQKEQKKAEEKAQHTPEMKSVEEIFLALATAILEDRPDKSTTPERLSREMILQGKIENDWPLEIRGSVNAEAKGRCVLDIGEIDCPEFLVYVKRKTDWTLRKAKNLEEAKKKVLTQGYNQKGVEQVIVLHNLKNLRFKLYAENRGEIEPISKSKAHTAKNLVLSWIKPRN